VALNPARVPSAQAGDPELTAPAERYRAAVGPGLAALEGLAARFMSIRW